MESAMIYGRLVDFESLRKDNMDIEPEIVGAGWRKFFEVRETIYQKEVYDFWKNMQTVDNTIVSTVDRLSVIVTMETIEKVTECSSAGEKLSSKARWTTQASVKENEINRLLYGNNDPKEKKASSLVPKARILHSILFHCILPRTGSRHLVTTLDEQCLFHLLNRQPVDLPFLIFHYMLKTKKEMNSNPYGMLLTRILRDSGVLLDRGNRMKINPKSFINSATIGKMGLKILDKKEADSKKIASTEGERAKKGTPMRSLKSQPNVKMPMVEEKTSSKDSTISHGEGSQVRDTETFSVKRKGEKLLSDIPKKAKRSPRVRSVRQQRLRKEDLKIKLIEKVQSLRSTTSIIIKEYPQRSVKAQLQPILVNNSTMHLLNDDEKSMFEFLSYEGTRPYPTHMTSKCILFSQSQRKL